MLIDSSTGSTKVPNSPNMNEHSAYKKPVFSQPTSDPTPLKQVRFVTLGGPDAGIFTLSE